MDHSRGHILLDREGELGGARICTPWKPQGGPCSSFAHHAWYDAMQRLHGVGHWEELPPIQLADQSVSLIIPVTKL